MVPTLVWLTLLVAGLVLVTVRQLRHLARVSRAVAGSMDRSTKRIGLVSLVPGIGTAAWLVTRGIAPPAAVVIGALCAFGVFAVLLSIFQMEGTLLETSSDADERIAESSPPPSTPTGRVVSLLVGGAAIGVCAYAIWIVLR